MTGAGAGLLGDAGDPRRTAFAERVRALAGGGPVAPLRDASTVVLLRDAADGPQAHVVRRASTMAFAGGMAAFPGGSVDAGDADPGLPWRGPEPAALAARLGTDPPGARALVACAVRETFEEAGVLLASRPGEEAVVVVELDAAGPWEALRAELERHATTLAAALGQRGLEVRADLLAPWAHWVTPEAEPRRYDTRFFVAALPAGSAAVAVGREADARAWVRPVDALAAARRGELLMLPPTSSVLQEIADAGASVAQVLAAAPARVLSPLMPRFAVDEAGDVRLLLPGTPEHAAAAPR